MKCKNCKLVSICNIYDFKKKHLSDVEMSIDFCKHRVIEQDNTSTNTNIEKTEISIADFTPVEPVRDIFGAREEDAKELERKLLKIEPVIEDKTLITCATCGGQDYLHYIGLCCKCGTETCGNCATTDNGLNYCSKCWEEM